MICHTDTTHTRTHTQRRARARVLTAPLVKCQQAAEPSKSLWTHFVIFLLIPLRSSSLALT